MTERINGKGQARSYMAIYLVIIGLVVFLLNVGTVADWLSKSFQEEAPISVVCTEECAAILDGEIYYIFKNIKYAESMLLEGAIFLEQICMPEEDLPKTGVVVTITQEYGANVGINNFLACNRGV